MKHMLPPYYSSHDRYPSFSSEDGCTLFTLSLPLVENSPSGVNGRRRPSFGSVESCIPPGLLSASSVRIMSPSTPLNDCSFSSIYLEPFKTTYPQVDLQSMWGHPQDDFGEHDFGYSPAVLKEQSLPKCFNSCSMNIHDSFASSFTTLCKGFSNDGVSPALSRPMFNETIPSLTPLPTDRDTVWPSLTIENTPPRTIDPSTFGPVVASTPNVKAVDLCTPSQQHLRSSIMLSSSPTSDYSPAIVPSQHDVDDSAFFDASDLQHEATHPTEHQRLLINMEMREKQSRLSRRRYDRKSSSSGCKRRPMANKSGFECDRVITANSFACSYPECIDKNTGKQKRFKRQEHKKRHEKTVHQKESHLSHRCWVPQCERSFSRTDNLKSHLKNTHGKRSPNARNRYVATLDPNNSQYYNPDWEGDLTTDGLPIGRRAGLANL